MSVFFKKIFYVLFVFIFAITSCENKKELNTECTISFNAKSNEEAIVELFYVYADSLKFTEKQKQIVKLKKTVDFNKVTFTLPQLPQKIRIDLAKNSSVNFFEIRDFELRYDNHTIYFENSDFNLFFKENEFVKEISRNKYKLFKFQDRFDPYLISTPYFTQRLKIEL